ncbi:PREDICTED: disease, partial [Prunus dulcis]
FPKDFEIPTNILTQLWVVEGFIPMVQQRQGFVETMEEIAFSYSTELVERCMVEIRKRGSVRKIKSCRLHDRMRDMCLLQSKEESFIQIVNLSHIKDRLPFPTVTEATLTSNVRRLGIYVDATVEELSPSRYERESHLRSLLYFGYWVKNDKELNKGLEGGRRSHAELPQITHRLLLWLGDSSRQVEIHYYPPGIKLHKDA